MSPIAKQPLFINTISSDAFEARGRVKKIKNAATINNFIFVSILF